MYFVDASALVKRYVREPGSKTVRQILDSHPVAISRLSEIEVPSALARLCREGRLSPRGRDRAIAACVADLASWHIVELTSDITALARQQVTRHLLGAGDALQLASALWLQGALGEPLTGVLVFDHRLLDGVRGESLAVVRALRPRARRPSRVSR